VPHELPEFGENGHLSQNAIFPAHVNNIHRTGHRINIVTISPKNVKRFFPFNREIDDCMLQPRHISLVNAKIAIELERIMRYTFIVYFSCLIPLAAVSPSAVSAQLISTNDELESELMIPISNEVSFYKNVDDNGIDRGRTFQVISINMFHIGTDFIVEFTGDFNWELDLFNEYTYDYYIELSLVKPVYKSLSINYQRIYGTFVNGPINQFGIRLSLCAGS
jgi:hypothetical protein